MTRRVSAHKLALTLILVLLGSGPLLNCECGGDHFAGPQLEVDSTVLKFDQVAVGYPQTRLLHVSNIGGSGLTLDSIAVQGGAGSPFSVKGFMSGENVDPQIPEFIGPGAAIDLVIEYSPESETADDHDTLDLLTNDPDECNPMDLSRNPCAIALAGTGAPPNAELEVVCQEDVSCPAPNDTAVCQVMLDPQTNTHPVRLSFNFCEVAAGYSRQLQALLKNTGNIPLSMSGFELFSIVGDLTDFGLLEPAESDIEIQPGADRMLTAVYAPQAEGADNSGIDLATNDDDLPSGAFSVRLLAFSAEPDIDVHPEHIPFEGVTQGQSATEHITINNTGSGTLDVSGLEVTGGSVAGEFSIDSTDGFTVASMGQQIVDVTYHPQDVGQDDGSVIIHSNDPDEPEVTVTLGADVRPDLEVNPQDWVEFIGVAMGGSASEDVTLLNVGYADLTITDIAFDPDLNPGDPPVFGIEGLPADFPANPLVLAPAGSYTFQVTFTDNTSIENEIGQMEISHDSPNDSNPYILLAVNQGTPANLPPVAKIDPPSQTVQGLNQVNLDGSTSFDPDAGDSISRYQWSFLFLPQNAQGTQSQSTLSATDTPQVSFTPDMPGAYIVRLVVYDSYNTPSQPVDSNISVNP